MESWNPCLSCGVCCAHYRVSFYWRETDQISGGHVPIQMTEQVNHHYLAMRGTNQRQKRCIALEGTVGESVSCSIYNQRPTPCREFPVFLEDGSLNPECNRIRAVYNLPPLVMPEYDVEVA